jgi:hypothetical protein
MPVTVRVEAVDGRAVVSKVGSGPQAAIVRAEAGRLRAAAHPGVVELLDDGPCTDGWQLRTVHGGRPLDGIARLPVEQAAAVVAATAETLADLHELGIVHGRVGPDHVLLGTSGRPQLCGLGPGGHDPAAPGGPADDVAALGRLLRSLVGDEAETGPVPERRWGRRRWGGPTRRSLLDLADQATAEPPTLRPTARRLARAAVEAVPEACLVAPVDSLPTKPPPGVRRDRAGPRHATAGPAVRAPRALSAAAVVTGVALVAVGVTRTVDDGPNPGHRPPATIPAPATTPVPSGEPAPTTSAAPTTTGPAPVPAGCPPGDPRGPDLDGDGCPDPVRVEGTTIVVGDRRFEVAQAGEVVVLGDWDCDGAVTPATLRSDTGEVFAFPRWPEGTDEVEVAAIDRVPGATALVVEPLGSGCDGLTVEVSGRGRVRVEGVGR